MKYTRENTYQMLEQVRSNLVEAALVRTPFEAGELKTIHLAGEPMMAAGLERFFEGIRKPGGQKEGQPDFRTACRKAPDCLPQVGGSPWQSLCKSGSTAFVSLQKR